jgi:hypothetical protein
MYACSSALDSLHLQVPLMKALPGILAALQAHPVERATAEFGLGALRNMCIAEENKVSPQATAVMVTLPYYGLLHT